MSLSNAIFSFRRNTAKLSTFAHSAQLMSGNTERTDYSKAVGHGMGSVGLNLHFFVQRKGVWEPMWKTYF